MGTGHRALGRWVSSRPRPFGSRGNGARGIAAPPLSRAVGNRASSRGPRRSPNNLADIAICFLHTRDAVARPVPFFCFYSYFSILFLALFFLFSYIAPRAGGAGWESSGRLDAAHFFASPRHRDAQSEKRERERVSRGPRPSVLCPWSCALWVGIFFYIIIIIIVQHARAGYGGVHYSSDARGNAKSDEHTIQ